MSPALRSLAALLILCVSDAAFVVASAATVPLEQLSWLSGCWTDAAGEPGSGEQWTTLAGGSMMGMGRTIRGGKLVTYEFMRIGTAEDGKPTFYAQPAGKPPASFAAIRLNAAEVVFENLAHDFPQRVIYRLEAPSTLHASIEGMRNGALKTIEYPMVRASCAGTTP